MEVTGISVERAQEIADASIVDGEVNGAGNLVLTTGGGAQLNAGAVRPTNAEIANVVYPVGSIYVGTTPTSPATLFGMGTWSRYAQGRVLVGLDESSPDGIFDGIGEEGGAKTHTLTAAQIPKHTHGVTVFSNGGPIPYTGQPSVAVTNGPGNVGQTYLRNTATQDTGDGEHNNLQPYIVVYMWRRTA